LALSNKQGFLPFLWQTSALYWLAGEKISFIDVIANASYSHQRRFSLFKDKEAVEAMQKVVRVVTQADLAIADTITMAAYNLPTSRILEIQRNLALQPDGWRLATLDGQAAAVGGAINYGRFSYVGLVGVLPSMQRHGLGAFLMNSLLAWIEQQHCPTILLDASDVGANLYQKLGFVEDDKAVLLSLTELPIVPAPIPEQVTTLQTHEIPELVAFDSTYFGAERARVFSRFLQEYPQRAFISRHSSGQITGYLFAQSRTLGPWIASTPTIAEQLLIHALTLPFGTEIPNVILSPSNQSGLTLLQRYGFRQKRQLSHMRLGLPANYRRRSQIYGQSSFAIG
jgi:GNAT superfamily N-acetyltransferase